MHVSWQALSHGDAVRCDNIVRAATRGVVDSLALLSTESAASVNPALVRLQMLAGLQEALRLSSADPAAFGETVAAWEAREMAAGTLPHPRPRLYTSTHALHKTIVYPQGMML